MLCCVTVLLSATQEERKRVRESEERSGKEDDSPPASDGGTGWESGSRSEHLNTLRHEHMHARCSHCTGLYLDDKWRYKPHSPFTLLSASGLKTMYLKLTKNKTWQNSTSQHTWFWLSRLVLPPLCVSILCALFFVLLSSPSVPFTYSERK